MGPDASSRADSSRRYPGAGPLSIRYTRPDTPGGLLGLFVFGLRVNTAAEDLLPGAYRPNQ